METSSHASPRPVVRLSLESYPEPPALDTAVSHAILRGVSEGSRPQTLRIHRPGPIVAFGPLDRLASRWERAVGAARDQGFGAVIRLAGGRAAVFHEQTVAFSWAIPDPQPRLHIQQRFNQLSAIVVAALRDLGVDARVGEVPGEYCPGQHSVNAQGKTKLMGVGQRLLLGAAHVGGVIVVGGTDRVADVLVPVYEALALDWDPTTTGSVEDEVPGISWDEVAEAVLARFRQRSELVEETLPPEILTRARELAPLHEVPTQT
jgi:octanoyl-[GcvH]:protein N-octanoyltransferase